VVIGMAFTVSSVTANTGGLALTTTEGPSAAKAVPVSTLEAMQPSASGGVRFGSRILREGMRGEDVRVLNGIVKARPYAKKVKVTDHFQAHTSGAVRRFQAENSLRPSGIVDRRTAKALAGSMRRAKSTWYGPGFYGNKTACGQTLRY